MNFKTLENGGLQITPQNDIEWFLLNSISQDALGEGGDWLAKKMSGLMDEESCWEDIIQPELSDHFSDQVDSVASTIQLALSKALSSDDPDESPFTVEKDEAEAWYGALNQARLSLEAQYRVSSFGPDTDYADLSPDVRPAVGRYEFYSYIQTEIFNRCIDLD